MSKQSEFIEVIGTLARNEYLSRDKWILPSVCIAQGALESGWNLNAKSLFGIKGDGFRASTKEFYDGNWCIIEDSFRLYPNVSSAVVGYYNFLRDTPRYEHCLNCRDYETVVYNLQHTLDGLAYATDQGYQTKIISIIKQYNLTKYDELESEKSVDELAQEVIAGKHGNGEERKLSLGSRYDEVQKRVNEIINENVSRETLDYDSIVTRVINGEFGNGHEHRKEQLEKLGYDYERVRQMVNARMGV